MTVWKWNLAPMLSANLARLRVNLKQSPVSSPDRRGAPGA